MAVSSTSCELREVKLSAKPQALLAASPKGTVPVLVLPGGNVIDESLDIMRWALANRDPEGWLARHDTALIDANDGPFKCNLDGYKYPEPDGVDTLIHRERGLEFLREINDRLAGAGQLGGPTRGLTDAAIMPFVRQFAAVDRKWFNTQPLPHLKAWLDGHLTSDLFNAIMVRIKSWSPGDPPVALAMPRDSSSEWRSSDLRENW